MNGSKVSMLVGAVGLGLTYAGTSQAAVLVEEGFNYAEASSVMGQGGGTGFAAASTWSVDGDGTMDIEGGRPHIVPTTSTTVSLRDLAVPLTDGDDVWISVTMDMDSTDHTRFYGLSLFDGGSERALIGMSQQQEWMYFDNAGGNVAFLTGVDPLTGNPGPVQLVVHLTLQAGADALEMWVVDEGGSINLATPDVAGALGDVGSVTTLRIGGGTGNGTTTVTSSGLIDDIVIATTAAEVVGVVPEPGSLALLSLSGLALIRRRRA